MAPPPLLQFLLLLLLCCDLQLCAAANVSYDHRALVVDGSRRVLISGSIHYPRSTPEMWPDLIDKSKDGGLDVIETYVFWNLHEPVQGQYDFEGRKDLVRFVKTVASAGLYVHLRIGPYVCAEWNYGGFPVWLHFIPGIKFRTDNEPFKREMQRFTAKIVDMMKQEKLYASQGGPIILSQIENEYGNVDEHYGPAAKTYINWSASMATSLDTGVPWVMCQQSDAPDPIINTCNGFYCDQFTPNSNQKPKIWTENWSGWFLDFGGRVPYRPVEDLAFSVARFFQRGGTFQNYYMYHGGTNFGRSSGGPFISTSYDYDAPIDEYGIVRQPKWGHLRDLHKAIKLCEKALIATDPTYTSLGPNLEIISQATLSETKYVKTYSQESDQPIFTSEITESGWKYVQEPVGISKTSAFKREGLLEQINTTGDVSDYLWYSISVNITGNEPFLFNETQSILHVESLGHVLHAFVNGQSTGSGIGNSDNVNVFLETTVSLVPGKNIIDLLSVTVGLQNYGPFFDLSGAGVTGPVLLKGQSGRIDLSSNLWTYQIGLRGEDLGLSDSSIWISQDVLPKNSPLIWYMTDFDAPAGNDPVAIEFTGMRKGMAWVNGESIGRYWPAYLAPQTGCSLCNYRGAYSSDKCLKNCGKPSQTLYHVPRSFIQPGKNKLILFEEMGGDPTKISFTTRQTTSLCGYISESHPAPVDAWNTAKNQVPVLHLECPYSRQVISSVKFASFGTPSGTCGRYEHGKCRGSSALAIVQEACVGAKSCDVEVSTKLFGDPCANVSKSLAVEAACS
ncbi:beta-galactosidase 6-like isoform X2 [Zingiber officinale]|uniref:beta-galactosidase 6-like isoform X2 n=1 Tax=Zingiber officinale TaxID=94328 RepID=UPI001C4B5E2B|nr:beta-galactosidase 6-like isoform X2 [Zingiber officinale]